MTLRTEIDNLTFETNRLINTVSLRKDILDEAVLSTAISASNTTALATLTAFYANGALTSLSQASTLAMLALDLALQTLVVGVEAPNVLISTITKKPTLVPSLSVDWTKKPTVAALTAAGWTISRAGEMTYFGAIPVKVAENLLPTSSGTIFSGWTRLQVSTPSVTEPTTGIVGIKLLDNTATGLRCFYYIAQNINLGTTPYRLTVLAKAAEYSKIMLGDTSTGRACVVFDLISGTTVSAVGTSYISSSIRPHELGGGLYWCDLVFTSPSAGANFYLVISSVPNLGATVGAGGVTYTGNGTSSIELYAIQLQHNFNGDYIPTTTGPITIYEPPLLTAATNELAYQHTSRGECVGLLLYPADTNILSYLQNLGTSWLAAGVAVSITKRLWAGYAPFWRIVKTDNTTSRSLGQAPTISITAGTLYTASIALLGDLWSSTTSTQVGIFGVDNTLWGSAVDSTAIIISGPGTLIQLGGLLFTISGLSYNTPTLVRITRKYPLAESRTGVYIYPGGSNSSTVGAAVLATRVHLSASPRYMPYIPTTTAAVTRGSQSIVFKDIAFAIINNPIQGTILTKASVEDLVWDINRRVIELSYSGNSNFSHFIANYTGGLGLANTILALTGKATPTSGVWSNIPQAAAYSYVYNKFLLAISGVLSVPDISGLLPIINQLSIPLWAGLVQRTEIYSYAMTDAELAAITTPGVLI